MTKQQFVNKNNYNLVADDVYTAAKASSIGSTDKRSQLSSDSIRKRDYLAITQPKMTTTNGVVSEFANNAVNMRTSSPFRSTVVQNWQEAKGQDFSQMVLGSDGGRKSNEVVEGTRARHNTQMIVPLRSRKGAGSNEDLTFGQEGDETLTLSQTQTLN